MTDHKKSQFEILVEQLDRELIARGSRISTDEVFQFVDKEGTPERETVMKQVRKLYNTGLPPNKALSHINDRDLVKLLELKTRELNNERGIWYEDDRLDFYEITDEQIKKNADCVAAICMKNDLIDTNHDSTELKVKNYGAVFNLCSEEPFMNQPIAAGRLCTGFLVKEDVIATAGHFADENNVSELRFVFGFKMSGSCKPETKLLNKNIYIGEKIIHRIYNRNEGPDWALVKLDRNVVDHPIAKLCEKPICCNQPLYILGHPCGLPLKYASGVIVNDIGESFFSADLNVYCGNSGSPVFKKDTHEVVGIVVRGDCQDFRWTGRGWRSIVYPNPVAYSKEPQCTKVSQFIDYCR